MSDASADTLPPVGYCPHCGYDQRGLPRGSVCPECGQPSWSGLTAGEINRWAEDTLLALWSIAVLLSIGELCGALAVVAYGHAEASGVMLGMSAVAYLLGGSIWYVASAGAVLRRRLSPAYKNVSPRRRQKVFRWVVYDALILAVPVVFAVVRFT